MGKRSRSARFFGASSRLLAAASGIAVLTTISSAAAQGNEARRYDIPAQSLSSALFELTKSANLAVIAPPPLLEGKQAPAITGDLSLSDALGQLLTGSGLEFELVGNGRTTGGTLILRQTGARDGAANYIEPSHLQLAQIATAPQRQKGTDGPNDVQLVSANLHEGGDDELHMEEMVVTGTLIRGQAPVGAQLFVLDRSVMDRSGFATTADVIRSLPQTLGAGASEATTSIPGTGSGADTNEGFGSGINLRGLGTDKTLTLVNGRRVAPGGTEGNFVDVSQIPLNAVERIEVLPDGASALYGSDAIGGVVNIILRRDYEGIETRFRIGAVTDGGQQTYKVGQTYGNNWDSGNFLVTYEYYRQSLFLSSERGFSAASDLTALGGDNFDLVGFGNPGTITAGGQTFAIPEGQDGTSLNPGDLTPNTLNFGNRREGTSLLPEQERHSAFAMISQKLGDRVELFSEGRFTDRGFVSFRPAESRNLVVPSSNPFFVDGLGDASPISVQYSFIDDLGAQSVAGGVQSFNVAAGGLVAPFRDWQIDIYGTFSRDDTSNINRNRVNVPALNDALSDDVASSAFNPFGDGASTNPDTIDTIRGFITREVDSEVWSVNMKADGSLFSLPGGNVKLAAGAEYREESLRTGGETFLTDTEPGPRDGIDLQREVAAVFAELFVPVFGPDNRLPGFDQLELSAAARVTDYSDFGTTTDPKVGIMWSPANGVIVRGTYGTSFRAPLLTELDTSDTTFFAIPIADPASPTGFSNAITLFGGNPDLDPVEATTWTVGVELAPEAFGGFNLSVNYFDIELSNRVLSVNPFVVLSQEEQFRAIITRAPDPALAQMFLDDPAFFDFGFGFTGEDIDLIIDGRRANVAVSEIRGLDIVVNYGFDTGNAGSIQFGFNGSVVLNFKEAVTPDAPLIEIVDTVGNQVDFRFRTSASWSYGNFSTSAFVNYIDNYTDNLSDPERGVDAWTSVDLRLAYQTNDGTANRWLNGISVSLSIFNLFDEDPPFVNNRNGVGFDPVNASPQGRLLALQVTKAW
ncbi:MAG: TonB-dependent receptor [Kiloniellales bacterium]|nr:TonB-dependent receptor [Kiloniellales bacterium]